jgi:hypothetical protein
MLSPKTIVCGFVPIAWMLAGCGDTVLEPLSEREVINVDVVNPESQGPYACEVIQIEPGLPFAGGRPENFMTVCKETGLECRTDSRTTHYTAPSVPDGPVYGTEDHYVSCAAECSVDNDCALPESGGITPTCVVVEAGFPGRCMLPCVGSEECPDGFSCWKEPRTQYLEDLERWTYDSPYPDHCVQHFQMVLPDGAAPP